MKDKLHKVIEHSGMSRNRFAEVMGIQPSGLSHILSGRNNPGYDFIVKLIARFPEINPYWLLGDSDRMLNALSSESNGTSQSKQPVADDSDKLCSVSARLAFDEATVRSKSGQTASRHDSETNSSGSENLGDIIDTMANISSVERVVIFFADKTFEVFTPRKKNL